jgi:hypothetical protein
VSYLTLKDGIPNFSQAVISLWFRAPKESVVAASANMVDSGTPNFPMLQKILLLVSFGKPQSSKFYRTPTRNVAEIHPYLPGEPDPATTYNTIYYEEGQPFHVDPSFIGLFCYPDAVPRLVFNLQMPDTMAISHSSFITTQMDIYSGSDPSAPVAEADVLGSGVVSLAPDVGVATIADASYADSPQPELFNVVTDIGIEPDQWHHLLLSFDVGGKVSIGTPFAASECRLWYAIDDKDYRGAQNLLPYRDIDGQWGPDTLNPNAVLTANVHRHSGSDPNWEAINYYMNHYIGLPSGSYDRGSIPSSGAELGLPASTRYKDAVFRVEMAEFQMWTGVTLDTGTEENRRAFVDADGYPVLPEVRDGKPPPAEKLLGKRPDILLHGNGDWIDGTNTGSLGIDDAGNLIPSGQFKPTAKIISYEPDPSLHGPQKPKAGPVRLSKQPAHARL